MLADLIFFIIFNN